MKRAKSDKSFDISSSSQENKSDDEDNSSVFDPQSSGSNVGNENDIVKVRVDMEDGTGSKIEFRRRATIKDRRSHTDKWVDKYFQNCLEKIAKKKEDWNELDEEE